MSARAERDRTAFVGMALALGSLAMLFASLLFSYAVLRYHAPAWPPEGTVQPPRALPAVGTLVLLASSAALVRGRRRAAALFGTVFLAIQAAVSVPLWRAGLTIGSGIYGSVFYALTGVHALFVLTGLAVLGASSGNAARQRPAAMLWHFVVLVWLALFAVVYLL